MRVPKLVIFLLMLGAAVISYIYAAVHSQIEMFHMFDESDNKKPGAASASTTAPSTMATAGNVIESEESANSESESDSETDSKSAPASS